VLLLVSGLLDGRRQHRVAGIDDEHRKQLGGFCPAGVAAHVVKGIRILEKAFAGVARERAMAAQVIPRMDRIDIV
jgi:hypothetical protein